MLRSVHSVAGLFAFGAAFTFAATSHATTITCWTIAPTSRSPLVRTFACWRWSVEQVDTWRKTCTSIPSTSCTTACQSQCTMTPASFSCTSDRSDQRLIRSAPSNNDCGASSQAPTA